MEVNKQWCCVSHALSKRSQDDSSTYDHMYSDVHVDKKWFDQTKDGVVIFVHRTRRHHTEPVREETHS